MPGKRDTDSDMGQSSRRELTLEGVNNNLGKHKIKVWGEFKLIAQSHGYLEKKVEEMDQELTEIAKTGATVSNTVQKAERVAGEAKKAAGVEHTCLHKQTMDNISVEIVKTTEKVESLDNTFRRALTWATRFVVAASIVVSGAVIAWQVQVNMQGTELETQKEAAAATRKEVAAQAESIKKLEADPEQQVRIITTAFEEVMEKRDLEAAKAKEEAKPPPRGRERNRTN